MTRAPRDRGPAPTPSSGPQAQGAERLLALIRRLRAPGGCPWDQEQTLGDLRAYLLEEAHETADAIDRRDWASLLEELGDLLFQVCFVAALAAEEQRFTFDDVVAAIHDKMVARHPHVFGGGERYASAREVADAWGRRKRKDSGGSVLAGVPASLPALTAAYRLGQKAAAVGFDWERASEVLEKVHEEVAELETALAADDARAVESELGDLLLATTSLARHLGCDPERALARANLRFRRRFSHVEQVLGERLVDESTPRAELRVEMERLWSEAKELDDEG
jgi:MazG family protein